MTLNRDFSVEGEDTVKHHVEFWVAWHYRGDDARQAMDDIYLALDQRADIIYKDKAHKRARLSWPEVLHIGQNLRGAQ